MKTRTKKLFALMMTLTMVISVAMLFTSCGNTLEKYIENDKEAKTAFETQRDAYEKDGITIGVKDNTMSYTFKLTEALDKKTEDQMGGFFDSYMDALAPSFEATAAAWEEKSGIEGIKVKVTFLTVDDKELYSREFEAAKAGDKKQNDTKAEDAE